MFQIIKNRYTKVEGWSEVIVGEFPTRQNALDFLDDCHPSKDKRVIEYYELKEL